MELETADLAQGGELAFSTAVQTADPSDKPELHVFRIELFDPEGLPVEHYTQKIVAPQGRGESRIALGLNEPSGRWRLKAQDIGTGQVAEATFEVRGQ